MTLTAEDLAKLKAKFPAEAHEFKDKFVYLDELAVLERIEEVDPAKSVQIISKEIRRDVVEEQAVVVVRLTIKGSTFDGVGMQKHNSVKDQKTGTYELQSTELEKGAATDALRRAARLAGVGRYLLHTPGWVKNDLTLAKWLGETATASSGGSSGRQPQPATTKASNVTAEGLQATIVRVERFDYTKDGKQRAAYNLYRGDGTLVKHWGSVDDLAAGGIERMPFSVPGARVDVAPFIITYKDNEGKDPTFVGVVGKAESQEAGW